LNIPSISINNGLNITSLGNRFSFPNLHSFNLASLDGDEDGIDPQRDDFQNTDDEARYEDDSMSQTEHPLNFEIHSHVNNDSTPNNNNLTRIFEDDFFRDDEEEEEDPLDQLSDAEEDLLQTEFKYRFSSPICSERFYREVIIHLLPNLKKLDGNIILHEEKEEAEQVVNSHFENLPYNQRTTVNLTEIVHSRQLGGFQFPTTNRKLRAYNLWKSSLPKIRREIYASKYQSIQQEVYEERDENSVDNSVRISYNCARYPLVQTLNTNLGDTAFTPMYSPRQFEYNPTIPELMVFGTNSGEVGLINHQRNKVIGGTKIRYSTLWHLFIHLIHF
jgi:hypothetical protein